jgi:hypothetical protein
MQPTPADNEVRLAEFSALREEIQRRSTAQQAILALNVTAIGSIAGLALTEDGAGAVLSVLPLVSSILGLVWIDHARNIEAIADYIRTELWHWTPSWEIEVRKQASEPRWRLIEFAISIGALFAGPSWTAIWITRPCSESTGDLGVWLLGLGLAATYSIIWIRFVVRRWQSERSEEQNQSP